MRSVFQCSQCYETLNVAGPLIGRRILCPMCETQITVPDADPNPVLLDQDLAASLEHFKLTAWDRACARKVLELKMVEPAVLRSAIRSVRNSIRANRNGMIRTDDTRLNEELVRIGAITAQTDRALCELVKEAIATSENARKECPNCLEIVPVKMGRCQFCGQELDDLLVYDTCANCKRRQPIGADICRVCGADVKTGKKPAGVYRICSHCGYEFKGEYLHCPKCHARLGFYWLRRQWRNLRTLRETLAAHSGLILLLLMLGGGVYVWRNWRQVQALAVSAYKGSSRAAMDERLDQFDLALKFGDLPGIERFLDPEQKRRADESVRLCILGGDEPGAVVAEVSSIVHADVILEDERGLATVYTETRGTWKLESLKLPAVGSSADLDGAARSLAGRRNLAARVAWKWVRRDGQWYYSGPLPGK